MLKIALTGNIACGKSCVEDIIKNFSIPIIDADKIVCDLYQEFEFIKEIKEKFSTYEIIQNGIVSKEKIRKIIFEDIDFRVNFEKFIHPIVFNRIQDFFNSNTNKAFVIASIPLLFECNWQNYFDKTIIVTTNPNTQIKRLMQRNQITEAEALKKINAQIPQHQKIKLADFVINNNTTIEDLNISVEKVLKELNEQTN